MKLLFAAAIAVVSLVGCGQLQNVNVADIRNSEHLRSERDFPLTMQQVADALYKYGTVCRDLPALRIDPANPRNAYLTFPMMGRSDSSAGAHMTFQQVGQTTHVKAYTYYSSWTHYVDQVYAAIERPDSCK